MAEGPGGADVRIRLVVDERGANTAEEMKKSLKGGSDELEKGGKHAEHLGSELMKAELYVELFKKGAELATEGIKQAWELTEKLVDAAAEAADEQNQQIRASAGLMSLLDGGAHQMGQIRDYAKGVREELEVAGTKAGVSTGQMEDMFDRVIERGTRSTEQAKELTEQMALVGKVVPGGAQSLSEGFSMMELGIVRARNPLVQLIAATGVLHGSARDVAQQMMKMTQAQQIEKATAAIEKQAEIMKRGGAAGSIGAPTLGELKASFGNIREGFLEIVGQQMLDKVVPGLEKLRDYLAANKETIDQFADNIGKTLGNAVETLESVVGDVYSGAVRDWDAIKADLNDAANDVEQAFHVAFGTTQDIHKELKDAGKEIAEAIKTVAGYIRATSEVLGDLAHPTQNFGYTSNMSHQREFAEKATEQADVVGPGSAAALDELLAKYRMVSAELGTDQAAVDAWTNSIREHHEEMERGAAELRDKVEAGDTDYISKYINSAVANQQVGAERWVFNLIAESDAMTHALMTGAIQVDGGFDALMKVIQEQSPELAKKLKDAGDVIKGEGGIKGHGPQINFNGGQTFNIKQDYRDQDPDRIIELFRRDVAKNAVSRRQSRLATAFGL